MQSFVIALIVLPWHVSKQQRAVLVVLVLLVGLYWNRTLNLIYSKDVGGNISLSGSQPISLEAIIQGFVILIGLIEHLQALHQQEFMKSGNVCRA